MAKIELLPDIVASQVAAGEVVDRPASVLKELLENSLDAGAGRIEVEFSRGGSGLIRVTDDGSGMERTDALMSLERHATSKIRGTGDLHRISTFGFRGEALPSIASVSRFRMATRPGALAEGTEILIEGGKITEVRDCGDSPGTTIEVRSLFFNVPARKKFLRTELTETAHLQNVFQTIALAHPEIAFLLLRDGRQVAHLPGNSSLAVRVQDLFGSEWRDNLLLLPDHESDGIRLSGMAGRPSAARLDKASQYFYLNRRPIQDLSLSRAVRDALPAQRQERGFLPVIFFLEMDPATFDCNVHPSKKEVRFHRPDLVRDALTGFLLRGLGGGGAPNPPVLPGESRRPLEETAPRHSFEPHNPAAKNEAATPTPPTPPTARNWEPDVPIPRSDDAIAPQFYLPPALEPTEFPNSGGQDGIPGDGPQTDPSNLPGMRVLSRLGGRYLLAESDEGLVLVDLIHAAERIFYEELVVAKSQAPHPAQKLLPPVVFRTESKDFSWLVEHSKALRHLGMDLEPFGENSIKIDSVPAGMDSWDPRDLVLRILDETRTGGGGSAKRFLEDQLSLSLAILRARRMDFSKEEPATFLKRLLACDLPYASPRGNPTMLQMGWRELERKFS